MPHYDAHHFAIKDMPHIPTPLTTTPHLFPSHQPQESMMRFRRRLLDAVFTNAFISANFRQPTRGWLEARMSPRQPFHTPLRYASICQIPGCYFTRHTHTAD